MGWSLQQLPALWSSGSRQWQWLMLLKDYDTVIHVHVKNHRARLAGHNNVKFHNCICLLPKGVIHWMINSCAKAAWFSKKLLKFLKLSFTHFLSFHLRHSDSLPTMVNTAYNLAKLLFFSLIAKSARGFTRSWGSDYKATHCQLHFNEWDLHPQWER